MTELEAVSGVGPGAAKKLREVFVTTAELLAVQNPVELQAKTKLGEGTITKIIRNARNQSGKYSFRSGLEIEKELETKTRLRTGLSKLDNKLIGGLEEGSIIELYGPARGGKTQWASHLAVRSQLPIDEGGLGGRVLWLDSESAFKPWVIRANALRFGLDPDLTLGNIHMAQIVSSEQISDLFESIPQRCAEEDFKLVVIDSYSGLFRAEFIALNDLPNRQKQMNSALNHMRRTALATDATFIYTNQVVTNIGYMSYDIPIGGHILAHASDYRFNVRNQKDDNRSIQLRDNAGIPEFKLGFVLGWGGFYDDAKEKKDSEPGIKERLMASGKSDFLRELFEISKEKEEKEKKKGKKENTKRKKKSEEPEENETVEEADV